MEVARAVIFVGYSLYDLDIARLLYGSEDVRRKCCFVVSERPSEALQYSLSRFGSIAPVAVVGAAQILSEVRSSHVTVPPTQVFHSFRKRSFSATPASTITDRDLFDLYVFGELNLELLPAAFASEQPNYYLTRYQLQESLEALERGAQVLLVHSYLGNGKTLFCQGLALLAFRSGYEVLEFDRNRSTLAEECQSLNEANHPTFIIVENYHRHFDVLERLQPSRNPNLRLLLTARTPVHLTEWRRLVDVLEGHDPLEVPVDYLSDDELERLDHIFEVSGFWGRLASAGRGARLAKLKHDCGAEFRQILLWVMDSEDIRRRINDIFDAIPDDSDVQGIVICALILRHLGVNCDIEMLAELSGVEKLNRTRFEQQPIFAEFLKVGQPHIIARSPLLAGFVLRTLWESGRVPTVLVYMLRRSLQLRDDDRIFSDIARDLMRFSKIDQLVPSNSHGDHLLRYYESIKNLEACTRNQFFWLQYSIAQISLENYPPAERYLETAYSLASRIPNFKTYQLDNTKARLLLQRCISEPLRDDSFAAFRTANQILASQMREREHSFYPYRVAALYGQFWSRTAQHWPDGQKGIFLAACRTIRQFLNSLDRRLAVHADVARCREALATIPN